MIIERKTLYHLHRKLNSRVLDFDINRISSWHLLEKYINPIAYLNYIIYPDGILNHLSRITILVFKTNITKYLNVEIWNIYMQAWTNTKAWTWTHTLFHTLGSKIIMSQSRRKSFLGMNIWLTHTHPTILQNSLMSSTEASSFLNWSRVYTDQMQP